MNGTGTRKAPYRPHRAIEPQEPQKQKKRARIIKPSAAHMLPPYARARVPALQMVQDLKRLVDKTWTKHYDAGRQTPSPRWNRHNTDCTPVPVHPLYHSYQSFSLPMQLFLHMCNSSHPTLFSILIKIAPLAPTTLVYNMCVGYIITLSVVYSKREYRHSSSHKINCRLLLQLVARHSYHSCGFRRFVLCFVLLMDLSQQ
jgi:hypothetical protein